MPFRPQLRYSTAGVLEALGKGYRYGFDIIAATGLPSGTVYPILRRLLRAGLVSAQWENEATAHRQQRPQRKYYRLTREGRAFLTEARARYPGLAQAVSAPGSHGELAPS